MALSNTQKAAIAFTAAVSMGTTMIPWAIGATPQSQVYEKETGRYMTFGDGLTQIDHIGAIKDGAAALAIYYGIINLKAVTPTKP